MKRILSRLFAVIALASLAHIAFAAPVYTMTVQPISQALKAAKLPGEYGNDTVISVINYSHTKIIITYPVYDPWKSMPHNSSTRLWAPNYTGDTWIRIQEDLNNDPRYPAIPGRVIFEKPDVHYRATISVDDSAIQYMPN